MCDSKGDGKDRCTTCGAYTCDYTKDQCKCDKCIEYYEKVILPYERKQAEIRYRASR